MCVWSIFHILLRYMLKYKSPFPLNNTSLVKTKNSFHISFFYTIWNCYFMTTFSCCTITRNKLWWNLNFFYTFLWSTYICVFFCCPSWCWRTLCLARFTRKSSEQEVFQDQHQEHEHITRFITRGRWWLKNDEGPHSHHSVKTILALKKDQTG